MLDGDLPEDLLRFSPVALEGHHHRHLAPDVAESLVVVGDGIGENLAVRDVDDPPARLVRLYPRADLVEGELEQAQVDDVAGMRPDLDAVPHFEGATPDDVRAADEGRVRLSEGA